MKKLYHTRCMGELIIVILVQWLRLADAQSVDIGVEYIVYTTTVTWNEARSVCHSIGGDLAKIDSAEVANAIIRLDQETPESSELANDFWIGLVWSSPTSRHWMIDCSELNSSFTSNYPENFDGKRCFYVDASNAMLGKRKDCNSNSYGFMCQRISDRCTFDSNPCDTLVQGTVSDFDTCTDYCRADITCEAALYMAPSSCYKVTNSTSVNQSTAVAMFGNKICIPSMSLTLNETVVNPPPDINSYPTLNCSVIDVGLDPEPSPTIASLAPLSIELQSSSTASIIPTCSPVVLTEMVTEHYTAHVTVMATPTYIPVSIVTVVVTSTNIHVSTVVVETTPSCAFLSSLSQNAANVTIDAAVEIAEQISKNLTVNVKKTSSYRRSLTSARDFRPSATAMGSLGMVCVIAPMGILMCLDLKRLVNDLPCIDKKAKPCIDKKAKPSKEDES